MHKTVCDTGKRMPLVGIRFGLERKYDGKRCVEYR